MLSPRHSNIATHHPLASMGRFAAVDIRHPFAILTTIAGTFNPKYEGHLICIGRLQTPSHMRQDGQFTCDFQDMVGTYMVSGQSAF